MTKTIIILSAILAFQLFQPTLRGESLQYLDAKGALHAESNFGWTFDWSGRRIHVGLYRDEVLREGNQSILDCSFHYNDRKSVRFDFDWGIRLTLEHCQVTDHGRNVFYRMRDSEGWFWKNHVQFSSSTEAIEFRRVVADRYLEAELPPNVVTAWRYAAAVAERERGQANEANGVPQRLNRTVANCEWVIQPSYPLTAILLSSSEGFLCIEDRGSANNPRYKLAYPSPSGGNIVQWYRPKGVPYWSNEADWINRDNNRWYRIDRINGIWTATRVR